MALELLKSGVHADAEVVLHLHAQGGDLVDLLVQDALGQAVLGDAVAEHAAHLGHGIHNGHPVALQRQVVGRGEAARAAADDAHPLAGGCGLGGQVAALGDDPVCGEVFQIGDGNGLLHHLPAAAPLAGVGAHPANGGGDGQALLEDAHGLLIVPPGDGLDIALGIHAGRAVEDAGAAAVPVVVAHQQFDAGFAGAHHPLGLRVNHLAVLGLGGAGPQQLGAALGLHHAEAAAAVVLEFPVVAEVGDGNAIVLRDLQEGLAGAACADLAVDGYLNSRFHSRPLPS